MSSIPPLDRSRLHLAALVAVLFLVYLPGLGGGFIFDDRPNITANLALQVTGWNLDAWWAAVLSSPASNFPRPLSMFSFALNHAFTGLDPAPMKLTNIAIHAINAVLVFVLAGRLIVAAGYGADEAGARKASLAALFVAAAWTLHPINFLSVLYVVQRMESLAHLFVFLGLLAYLDGRRRMLADAPGGFLRAAGGVLLFTMLGVGAKESAVLLPLYAFVVELALFRFRASSGRSDRRLQGFFLLFLLLPALAAAAWLLPPALGPNPFPWRNFDLAERLLTEARVVGTYLGWSLYPNLQAMGIYQDDFVVSRGVLDPPTTLAAILLLLGLAVAGIHQALRGRRLLGIGILWFLAAHLLTGTIIPLELVFEHRNYFASVGVCLAVADFLLLAPGSEATQRYGRAAAVVVLVMFSLGTALRSWEWRDPLAFAVSEAAKRPQSPRAVYALGVELSNLPELTADAPVAKAAFEKFDQARALPDSDILPDQASLMLASRLGVPLKREWWAHMQERLRTRVIGPQDQAALRGLVECQVSGACKFPEQDMMATFHAALGNGRDPEVQNLLGVYVLNVLHQPDVALYLWHSAHLRNPREPEYLISMVKLLIALDRYDEANEIIQQLRGMGRLGKNENVANQLTLRMEGARQQRRQGAK
jgi:hypothetical protein